MLDSIIPIFIIILLGIIIRRTGWLPLSFFTSVEKFSYRIAFPALLFAATARLNLNNSGIGQLALATLLPTLIISVLTLLILRLMPSLPNASRSSIVQGAMRPNSYFGIAVSAFLFDPQSASRVMLALALCLPVVNGLSILALSWWGGHQARFRTIVYSLMTNPIILSTVTGILVSLSGLPLPAMLMNTLDILGKAALCLGLLCIGAGLVFTVNGANLLALTLTSTLKLLAMPAVATLLCLLLALPAPVTLAAVFYCALPTAPNAYIMSKQMGGDAPLMAAIITLQTLLAMITVPLSLSFLQWAGTQF